MATTAVGAGGGAPRRRRAPAQARAEILDAAAALLAERPAHEATVSAVMERTTLSRKSFYVYFRDRADLLAALLAPLRADADRALTRWRDAADPIASGRAALREAAALYRRHGMTLRALATASAHDPDAARVWAGMVEPLVAVAAEKVAAAAPELDAPATARALMTMNVHHMLANLPGAPEPAEAAVVATLGAVWERTLFPWVREDG
ncbi:TetR family transcriptional regulator [Actinokineospora bangkokensis]|uniref:HTH tetR-type domain-containing protein n=1 Tax=Actinokineospora bangkokensis TaxID=1193682 RepID=A0A1Q9LMP4_9PSEU|nr:TetR family transcriptional regulator [Actinokineospora bangkokensis]OLR93300.1 hypothetical protein BJP25_17620 [Actinokineospora bangkokensis]